MNISRLLEDCKTAEKQKALVFIPVPEYFRSQYVYWRAAHLGKLAILLDAGEPLVPDGAFFTDSYDYGVEAARSLASGCRKTQWNEREDPLRFEMRFGVSAPKRFPAILFARTSHEVSTYSDDPLKSASSLLGGSDRQASRGVQIAHTAFADLDPHTQEFFEGYFELA